MEQITIIISIIIVTFIGTYGIIVRRKANDKMLLAEGLIKEVENRIQKEIVDRASDLNQTARWLDEQIAVVLSQKRLAEKTFKESQEYVQWANDEIYKAQQLKKDLETLRNASFDAIKDNKKKMFEVRESSLWLYDHYKKTAEILGSALKDDIAYDEICSLLCTASNNMNVVRQMFIKDFRQTPEQYAQQKVNATGRNLQGGEEQISGFSKN